MGYAGDIYGEKDAVCSREIEYLNFSSDCVDEYFIVVEYFFNCDNYESIGVDGYSRYDYKDCGSHDSGDCNDPSSSAYPCDYVDDGDCTDSRSAAYPCDSYNPCAPNSSYFDPCVCDPASCEGDGQGGNPPDCTVTSCPTGYNFKYQNF